MAMSLVYGLEVTHGLVPNANQVAATAFQKLSEMSLDEPDPNPLIKVGSPGTELEFAL